jgi:hypothetical protein
MSGSNTASRRKVVLRSPPVAGAAERRQQRGSGSQPSGSEQPTDVLAGSIARASFLSPANGFCVLRIKARG